MTDTVIPVKDAAGAIPADARPVKLMTLYLPLPAGLFAAILSEVGRHYPDAVVKSQTISICHIMSRPPDDE